MPWLEDSAVLTALVVALGSTVLLVIWRKFQGSRGGAGPGELAPGINSELAKQTNKGLKVLALVNPVGGKLRAVKVWNSFLPTLKAAGLDVTTVVTTHAGHGAEVANKETKKRKDQAGVIVCVGGDGFFYEVINGMSETADTPPAIPLALVPEGTGNGCATSIGLRTPEDAVRQLTMGSLGPLDLIQVMSEEGGNKLAALSVAWGAIADHDFLAEGQWRWMGSIRTIFVPLLMIAQRNAYKGRVLYVPHDKDQDYQKLPGRQAATPPTTETDAEGTTWQVLDDEFVMVQCTSPAWIATDFCSTPDARHDDGVIHINMLRGKATRWDMLKLFLDAETGSHVNTPVVEFYACTRLRIEPADGSGHIAVDGENLPCCHTEARIMPGRGKIYTHTKD